MELKKIWNNLLGKQTESEQEVNISNIKQAENKLRDLINLISIMTNEEITDGTQKIEDKAAEELKEKLREIAKLIGKE